MLDKAALAADTAVFVVLEQEVHSARQMLLPD